MNSFFEQTVYHLFYKGNNYLIIADFLQVMISIIYSFKFSLISIVLDKDFKSLIRNRVKK